jgi:GntR family transcriptional regulator/MocR family aminotransferase
MISYTLTKPKYRSLYLQLRKDIISKRFAPHEKLPSKREMANWLDVSLITIENAYQLLLQEGYVYTKERSGYYVMPLSSFQTPKEDAFQMQMLPMETGTSDESFPASLWYKTMRSVISMNADQLLLKSPNKGCARLRNAIASYLHSYRGMHVQPSQIIIGSGAESLYESLAKMFRPDMSVIIEKPCYEAISMVYDEYDVRCIPMDLQADGLPKDTLMATSAKFLHVTPFSSYPSYITTSAARRHDYIAWAKKYQGYIIEDDFNSEFFQDGPLLETLYSLDQNERVIYINTFSKSLTPSLRIGYMVLPFELMPLYEKKLGRFSNSVPLLEQYTLAAFIENGSFEELIRRRRRMHKNKTSEER